MSSLPGLTRQSIRLRRRLLAKKVDARLKPAHDWWSGQSSTMLLSDVLIIDATDRLGWLAGRVLADLGADVIKLEPPGTDRSRPDWRAFNVNKRIVELDPRTPADRPPVEDLLPTAAICLLTPETSA